MSLKVELFLFIVFNILAAFICMCNSLVYRILNLLTYILYVAGLFSRNADWVIYLKFASCCTLNIVAVLFRKKKILCNYLSQKKINITL